MELARTLTDAASDAEAIIHFDANASKADFDTLASNIQEFPKLSLVENRVKCAWGGFSLVQAVLNAIQQASDLGKSYDYVVLLSGACLPCRPIEQLERFLAENAGREFIEAEDETWMVGGYRKERYQQYFLLPASPVPSKAEHRFVALQKLLGIKRTPPDRLEVRFGSQWWALTWKTCANIVNYLAQRPDVVRFFRRTYIPDEMVFPTLVWRLADRQAITGFGLTHFQFTDRGKPTVFYEDHQGYPFSLDRFFYRKVAREASNLRALSIQRAFERDDGADLSAIGRPNTDYEVKARRQTDFPVPGQLFYRDRYADAIEHFSDSIKRSFVFICGSDSSVRTVLASIKHPSLQVMGRIFAPDEVDFGPGTDTFFDLRRDDSRVRDLHPLYYLSRVVQRSSAIPVFGWVPGDSAPAMNAIVGDPNALIVAIPSIATNGLKAETILNASLPSRRPMPILNTDPFAIHSNTIASGLTVGKMPAGLFSALDGQFAPNILAFPRVEKRPDSTSEPNYRLAVQSAASISKYSLENCLFRFHPWFPSILKAVQEHRNDEIQAPLKAAQ